VDGGELTAENQALEGVKKCLGQPTAANLIIDK
jgi:hypothetical protein